MNANELADWIKVTDFYKNTDNHFINDTMDEVEAMLRQQQAEIEAGKIMIKGYSKVIDEQQAEIDRLTKANLIMQATIADLIEPLKTLTNEEILELWDWNSGEILATDLLDFADAILRKAQEK